MAQSWLSAALPTLNDAISHINRASDLGARGSAVDRAEALFRALNRLWNVFALPRAEGERGDNTLFATLLKEAITGEDQKELLDSQEVGRLASLDPAVLNHAELNRARWQPGSELTPRLRQDATEDHRRFRAGLDRYLKGTEEAARVLKKLTTLLYVVRSNIAHGEKTPYSPDLAKRNRDEAVCDRVVPVQEAIVRLVMQRPEQKLVAYGTLVPGGVNHKVVAGLAGAWQDCTVHGRVFERAGVLCFQWDPAASGIRAKLLVSGDLPTPCANNR